MNRDSGARSRYRFYMCQRITCPKCGKPTWTGCGQHIEEALRGVPPEQRCTCEKKSLFAKLMGR
ncbi:MAG: hypothetical protein WCQ64_06585 [Acidobacteriota bacterium]